LNESRDSNTLHARC